MNEKRQTVIFPPLVIKGKTILFPIIQGGMGVGVSLAPLASAVAREGGAGIVSSAGLDRLVSKRIGKKIDIYTAIREEMSLAQSKGGITGINIMFALQRDYPDSVRGAIDGKSAIIICGAGVPVNLPEIADPKETALIPIVSSARALDLICRKWERGKRPYRPDAAVLEGPLAGGHLGFKIEEINLESNRLEVLLPQVKETAAKYGNFPVIVAGGIFTYEDIQRFLALGADGVQMGTRFLATEESSASEEYKKAVVEATKEDIVVSPHSPCGLPFVTLKQSPMYLSCIRKTRAPKCNKGYVMINGICKAKESRDYFCICNGLLSSAGYNSTEEFPLYTVGANGYRVNEIMSVKALMDELKGGV